MFVSRITKKVAWGELDALGIVFYPRYYEWMDEASHIFFERIGLDLNRLLYEKKIIFALVETGAKYIKPAKYHDELEIKTYIKKVESKLILVQHEVIKIKDNSVIMEGYEKRICIRIGDDGRFKAVPIPEELIKKIEQEMT
jgi:YbgC/YbaW family acyl-CoA thioester hydrolase